MKKEESKEFLGATEEERKEALAKDIAGLGEKIFICKKKGKKRMAWVHRENLIGSMWQEITPVGSSLAPVPSDSIAGQQNGKKSPRSFNISFTLVDDK